MFETENTIERLLSVSEKCCGNKPLALKLQGKITEKKVMMCHGPYKCSSDKMNVL